MTNPPPPSNFLSLSLEIRQQILSYSFEDPFHKDITHNQLSQEETYKLRIRGHDIEEWSISSPIFGISAPNFDNWAITLSQVHESIAQDLPFVLKQYMKDLEIITMR